jgi:DNA invertase Pin-like site-specific DNA recombinase
MKIARIYLRVSTEEKNIKRQSRLINTIKNNDFYVAGIYSEEVGNLASVRPELQRLISDLQVGDWIFLENIERITQLRPLDAESLIEQIVNKRVKIQVPKIFDFEEIKPFFNKNEQISLVMEPILEVLQSIFCKIVLDIANHNWQYRKNIQLAGIEDAKKKGKYKGRKANKKLHEDILTLRNSGFSIKQVCNLLNTSQSTVLRITRQARNKN